MKNQELAKANGSQSAFLQKQEPWKPCDRASLAVVIGRVFDLQKQYGKTSGQLETLVEGFCWAMQAYPVEMVIDGIGKYILQKSDMPTPSDIRQIIDPVKPVWKPDWAFYSTLKKIVDEQGPYGIDQEEADYIKACEDYSLGQRRA